MRPPQVLAPTPPRARSAGRAVGPSEVRIGALGMSVPGRSAPFGRRVAERVSALLAERCPPGLQGQIGRVAVEIRAGGASEEALSESIAEAVLGALQRRAVKW